LKLLDLSSNFIADFPAAMVKKLKSLDRLLLRKNSVQSLEKDSFQVIRVGIWSKSSSPWIACCTQEEQCSKPRERFLLGKQGLTMGMNLKSLGRLLYSGRTVYRA
jgi:hypothetical protein